jgi:hypothetical protein
MIAHVTLDDRLSILRAGDRFRRWNSLDDQRICGVCERKFKGRQVEIRHFTGGRYTLHCPTLGCTSAPDQWLYPRAAVVSEMGEPDWWRAGKQAARRAAESMPQARRHRV